MNEVKNCGLALVLLLVLVACQTTTMPEGERTFTPGGYYSLCLNQPDSPLCPKK